MIRRFERCCSPILASNRSCRSLAELRASRKNARRSKLHYSHDGPATIVISTPNEEACRKLRALFAETLDTRLIALACLPNQFRSEGFLAQLKTEPKPGHNLRPRTRDPRLADPGNPRDLASVNPKFAPGNRSALLESYANSFHYVRLHIQELLT